MENPKLPNAMLPSQKENALRSEKRRGCGAACLPACLLSAKLLAFWKKRPHSKGKRQTYLDLVVMVGQPELSLSVEGDPDDPQRSGRDGDDRKAG